MFRVEFFRSLRSNEASKKKAPRGLLSAILFCLVLHDRNAAARKKESLVFSQSLSVDRP